MVANNTSKKDIFSSLSLEDKYTWISEHGKYIGVRFYYNYYINLYLVDDNFYELFYFLPINMIERIEPLDDMKKLDLYIKYMQDLNESKFNPYR